MNRTELLERLDGTEWADFELKSAQGGVPVDAFKTLSAFANSNGGWLVYGVGELTNDGGRKRFEVTFPWGEERVGGVSEPINEPGERVNRPSERAKRLNERLNDGLNQAQGMDLSMSLRKRVLRLVRAEPGVRVPEIVARLEASESSVRRVLRALKADGRATFRGAPKTGGYYPTASVEENADS